MDHSKHLFTVALSVGVARGSRPEAHWKFVSGGGGAAVKGEVGGGGEGGGYCTPAARSACRILGGVMMFEPS